MRFHSFRKFSLALSAVLLAAGPLVAATPDGGSTRDDSMPDLTSQILKEERDSVLRIVGLGRLRVSHPQRTSVAVGAMLARQPTTYDCTAVCEYKGLYLQAEPGYSGGRISAGYAVLMGEKGNNERFLSKVYMGYGVKGALLRTWNSAALTPSDQTLLGIEGDFTIIGVNFSVGLFRHVGAGDPDDPWVLSGGIGWGF
jgi:hypothetical protein